MVIIEYALREKLSPALFRGEEVDADFWKIPGHSVKRGRLGTPEPCLSEKTEYNTYRSSRGELVGSLLGGIAFDYVGHRDCVCGASAGARKEWKYLNMADLDRQKELVGVQERNLLYRSMMNGVWISDIPYYLNSTEQSWEGFYDNLCLRYGWMPQDIPATCDGCDNKFLIDHALSCLKGALFCCGMKTLQRSGATLEPRT